MRRKRLIALVLATAMLLDMMPGTSLAAEQKSDTSETTVEESEKETVIETAFSEIVESVDETLQETESMETEQTETETGNLADSETSEDVIALAMETETEKETVQPAELKVTSTKKMTFQYDDRYSFSKDFAGYSIVKIDSLDISSYQVSNGARTDKKDSAVLSLKEDSKTDVIATGIGTAVVLLVPSDQFEDAKAVLDGSYAGEAEVIEAIEADVTVTAATLTVMFLAGQSNMEGYCSDNSGYHTEDSIVCEEGQVYSTFAPYVRDWANRITGNTFPSGCTKDKVASFVAGSLTDNFAQDGSTLSYKLDALTKAGKGKTGPDSGLAYEWNRLTGDKVWTINTAVGSVDSASWVPGAVYYEQTKAVYEAALKTMNAEIKAGHYKEGKRLMFWQQGETDSTSDIECAEYLSNFRAMYKGLKAACGIDYCGIIVCRAHKAGAEDISMTGARAAQYSLAISAKDSDVFIVSNENEQWVSDSGVKAYFSSAYPGGKLSYPLRSKTTLSGLPSKVSSIHDGIHYSQIAHNENGLTAARCMYQIVKGGSGTVSAKWIDGQGKIMTSVNCPLGGSIIVVPSVTPLYMSKNVKYSVDSDCISYDVSKGCLNALKKGTGILKLTDSNNRILASVKVTVGNMETTKITSAASDVNGVVLKWNTLYGARSYYIYRKAGSGNWVKIGSSSSNSYTDTSAKSGTKYTYTVRASYGGVLSDYDKKGITITYMGTPALTSVANVATGVQVKWNAVAGANQYYVYRKSENRSWTRVGTVKTTSYIDTTAVGGTKYSYTVVANGKSVSGSYDKIGKSITYLSQPVLTLAKNDYNSVIVTWKESAGAASYYIYRKSGNSGWVRVGSTDKASYTDTTVKSGTTYVYTVRALADGILSSYDAKGVSVVCLGAPALTSAVNNASGVKVSWGSVSGASQYNVYRKNDTGGWTKIGSTTSTNYIDKNVVSGSSYCYTVVARSSVSSGFDREGKTVKYLKQPTLAGGLCGDDFVTVVWDKILNAEGYYVYRKTGANEWARIADITDTEITSYTDKTVISGTKYSYTVRAYAEGALSSYDSGKTTQCAEAPAAVTDIISKGGECKVILTWKAASKATGYSVEYKDSENGSWTIASDSISDTSYEVTNLKPGKKYYFRIKSYTNIGDFKSYGDYSKEITGTASEVIPAKPTGVKATAGDMCVKLSWTAATNATGYNIELYDAATGTRVPVGSTRGTSFTAKNLKNGTKYSFVIRSYRQCGDHITRSAYASAVSATPVITPPTAPKSLSVAYTDGSNKLTWPAVENATGYYIYLYNYDKGKYEQLGTATTNSYIHKGKGSTGKFKYQVKTYRVDNGKTYVSSDSVTKLVFGADDIKSVQSEVHPIYYGATINQGTRLYKTFSATEKCGTINPGERVTVLYRRTKRCKIKRANGDIVYVKTSALNYTSQQYTSKDYTTYQKEVFVNSMGYKSDTSYLIWISTYTQRVNIFKKTDGLWTLYKGCKCATGAIYTPTPLGSVAVWAKQRSHRNNSRSYYSYLTKFKDANAFHTRIRYDSGGFVDSRLGLPLSNGCVRMYDEDAIYIYNNVPKGTTVVVY